MRKGFAPAVILIALLITLITAIGIFYFYLNPKDKKDTVLASEQCATLVEDSQDKTQVKVTSNTESRSSLQAKMVDYTNYQLDRTQIFTNLDRTIHSKFIRAGDKLATFDEYSPLIMYTDIANCNENIFSPPGEFAKSEDLFELSARGTFRENFEIGTPEHYLNKIPQVLTIKPNEKINDKIVNVYEAKKEDVLFNVFIDPETGLPAKIISNKINSNNEIIIELTFSRIGEIQDSEVTLPPSARKVSKKQLEKADKFLNDLSN